MAKPESEKAKIRTTSLTDDQFEYVKKVGEGSFTKGIRNMAKISALIIDDKKKLKSFDDAYLEAAIKIRNLS